MRALKWAHTDARRIIILAVRMASISEAPKLKCAAGCKRLTMHDVSAGTVEPGQDGLCFRIFKPALIPAKIREDVLLLLKHEGHATVCSDKRAERISKPVRLVVVSTHLVPPIVDLMESIVGQRDRASSTVSREALSERIRL